MRKFLRPIVDAMERQRQAIFFQHSPVKAQKIRRYEHVDLSKEFEIRKQRREEEKKKMLNEVYEKHDERVNYLKTTALPADVRSGEPSDTDALTDSETLTRR